MSPQRASIVVALAVAVGAAWPPLHARRQAGAPPMPPVITVDIVAIDRNGRFVDDLDPATLTVTVDGKPRRIVWIRHVSRGPGAANDAAARVAGGRAAVAAAAEPSRSVLVVIDETSFVRGGEREVTRAAGALLDRLGLDDRVGVVRLPMTRDTQVTLSTERPDAREALRRVAGLALPSSAARADEPVAQSTPPSVVGVSEPAPVSGGAAPAVEGSDPGAEASPDARDASRRSLAGLQRLMQALRGTPGRKVVVVFSAGLTTGGATRADDVALAAVSANAVVHGFALPAAVDELPSSVDAGALERLARLTGGSFVTLARNPDRSIEKVMAELSACYVLGLESMPSDAREPPGTLRIQVARSGVTLRAPSSLAVHEVAPDLVVAPPGRTAGGEATAGAEPSATPPPATVPKREPADAKPVAERDLALQRLLGRAVDYVADYQREYSLLVAEEEYVQRSGSNLRRLRSDLLLVHPSQAEGWVSFRDAFEVDGAPVRDRDDRLRKLFLDPSTEAQARLQAIKDESARYNIGKVERNINVPLFPLQFLDGANLSRLRLKLGGKQTVNGVEGLRLEYEEVTRPTLTLLNGDRNLPARGWFVVDPASGAVLGTRMTLEYPGGKVDFIVRYQPDERLGLWVPAEMQETYLTSAAASMSRGIQTMGGGWNTAMEARATYSNFRRFQTKVEETIEIPRL